MSRTEAPAPTASPARNLAPPPGITVSHQGHRLRIDLRWSSWARWRLVVCSILGVVGISLALTLIAHASGRIDPRTAGIVNGSVLAAMLVVGALLVTGRTTVRVEGKRIRVRHRPYLLPAVRNLSTEGLAQLFCIRVRGREGSQSFFRFHLVAPGQNGRKAILVPALRRRDQALFLEDLLETHLGIPDRPVAGELRRVAPRFKPSPRHPARKPPSFQFGLIMKQFVSQPRLSRRGRFVRDIRFMLTGKEFKARDWRGKPRKPSR